MSVATVGNTRSSDAEKYVLSIQGKMSESPTSEPSKADKKREYNRNAQRVFRLRRKEHLKSLEAAQKEKSTVQSEEIKRLRDENLHLLQENQNLKRAYHSGSSSPVGIASASPTSLIAQSAFAAFPNPTSYIPDHPQATNTSLNNAVAAITPNLCVMAPRNLGEIRRQLHTLFAPILEVPVISDPQTHLAGLAILAQQLPPSLKPTELQLTTPHHAYIDLIPSPSLRERLIGIGPANASGFMTQACPITCDIEDHGQLTIWGEDWLNEFSWEFSEAILERWGGWLLDRQWGQRANFWRRQRGLPTLPAWEG